MEEEEKGITGIYTTVICVIDMLSYKLIRDPSKIIIIIHNTGNLNVVIASSILESENYKYS